jgi:DNA-binding beta-propeller fold protein YncE
VFIKELAVPVWEKYPWHYPDVAFDENTKNVYLTNGWKGQILAMDLDGNPSTGEVPSDAVLSNPSALLIVATKKDRRLIVLNTGSAALSTFDLKPISGKQTRP